MAAIDDATRGIERERDEVRHRLSLEFGRVVDAEEISCVYQPIVTLRDFVVRGYELLARGPRESELHRPEALFEVARAEARVPELDRICRMTAARAAAGLPSHCLRFINAEPLNLFFHPDSDAFVQEFVEATPPALRAQTVVEITENAVIDDFAHMREVVRRLRGSGFRIAIDDAGAGYAGLQTMVEIEPDFIKLDMSLTRGIESSLVKQKLVGTLRDFCRQAYHHAGGRRHRDSCSARCLAGARDRVRPGLPLRAPRPAPSRDHHVPAGGRDRPGRRSSADAVPQRELHPQPRVANRPCIIPAPAW